MSDYTNDDRIEAITTLLGHYGSDMIEDRNKALVALDATPNEEIRALIDKYKQEEQHELSTESEKVIWGTVINRLQAVIDDYE